MESSAPAVPVGVQLKSTSACAAFAGTTTELVATIVPCWPTDRLTDVAITVTEPVKLPAFAGAPVPVENPIDSRPSVGDQFVPALTTALSVTFWPRMRTTSSVSSGNPTPIAPVPVWPLLRWNFPARLDWLVSPVTAAAVLAWFAPVARYQRSAV